MDEWCHGSLLSLLLSARMIGATDGGGIERW